MTVVAMAMSDLEKRYYGNGNGYKYVVTSTVALRLLERVDMSSPSAIIQQQQHHSSLTASPSLSLARITLHLTNYV